MTDESQIYSLSSFFAPIFTMVSLGCVGSTGDVFLGEDGLVFQALRS